MKTVKNYLPFEIDFISNDNHSELIYRHRTHGLGIYFMVLMELRNHPDYRCRLTTIIGAARRCKADFDILQSVLTEFELFEFHRCGNRVLISSPYVNRVMQPYDEKASRFTATVSKNTVTVEAPVYAMSTVDAAEIINITINKIKTKTTTVTNNKAATAAEENAAAADHDIFPSTDTPPNAVVRDNDVVSGTVRPNGVLTHFNTPHAEEAPAENRLRKTTRANSQAEPGSERWDCFTGNRMPAPPVQWHKQGAKPLPYRAETGGMLPAECADFGAPLPQRAPPCIHGNGTASRNLGIGLGAIYRCNRHLGSETVAFGSSETGIRCG